MSHHATSLFDLPLPAAAADPATSKQAAREIIASGKRDADVRKVATLVAHHPSRTSLELSYTHMAAAQGLDRHTIARRLPDAERVGLVRRGEPRQCRESGNKAVTWLPIDDGSDRLEMSDA